MTYDEIKLRMAYICLTLSVLSVVVAFSATHRINEQSTEIKVLEAQLLACETGKAILD